MSLQTGNNPPTKKGILNKMRTFIQINYRCKHIGPIGDPGGPYAHRMMDDSGESFILLVKGSRLWVPEWIGTECLSFQRQVIKTAQMCSTPLLLGFCPGDFPYSLSWRLYDPESVLENGWDANLRSPSENKTPSKMWNFPFNLGKEIDGPTDIKKEYESLKVKSRQVRL